MRVEIVQNQMDTVCLRIKLIHQSFYLIGKVLFCAPVGHGYMPLVEQWFKEQNQIP